MPPHSTHLIQPLDLGIFGPQKHYKSRLRVNAKSEHVELIVRVLDSLFQASRPSVITAAFSAGGIVNAVAEVNGAPVLRASVQPENSRWAREGRRSLAPQLECVASHEVAVLRPDSECSSALIQDQHAVGSRAELSNDDDSTQTEEEICSRDEQFPTHPKVRKYCRKTIDISKSRRKSGLSKGRRSKRSK